jgi:hypothetical protein
LERSIRGLHIILSHSKFINIVTLAGPKKRCLGPQNDLKILGPENLEKTTKMKTENAKMKSVSELVGIGGWPPISTCINVFGFGLRIWDYGCSMFFPMGRGMGRLFPIPMLYSFALFLRGVLAPQVPSSDIPLVGFWELHIGSSSPKFHIQTFL